MNASLDKRTTTNMTSKGQVLIPKDVRVAIGLTPGQPVDVGINEHGQAVVVPSAAGGEEPFEHLVARRRAALKRIHALDLFGGRSTEGIMRELRDDEPLP